MHLNCSLVPAVNQRIHLGCLFGSAPSLFGKIIRNFSAHCFSNQVEGSVTWKKGPHISAGDVCPYGKSALPSPFVGQRERAAAQRKDHITEAIVLEHLAAPQPGVHGLAMHSVHQHFAVV